MAKFSLIIFIVCIGLGSSNAVPTQRVVGGVDATEGQFPYQISLRRNGLHTCGGSIISRYFVLTAAHCVGIEDQFGNYIIYNPNVFTVRAGSKYRLNGGVVLRVTQIIAHENYGNFLNDVALLRLESPLIYSKNIQAIPLASAEVPDGKQVIISGWGYEKTNGETPSVLQWNTLEAISKSRCRDAIDLFEDNMLCLAHQMNNGACSGDSGGPAVYNGEVVGIAGFVVNGCGSSNPDGYAKVYYHRDWIRKHSDL